jgi:hypothetical protein
LYTVKDCIQKDMNKTSFFVRSVENWSRNSIIRLRNLSR